jgi:two-component system response regulator HydG
MTHSILIVDDDADICLVLTAALRSLGEVRVASNGADGLRCVKEWKPRLILLDVVMPVMGGIEMLKAVRDIDPSAAVVMLTGESDLAVAKDALDRGARSYITKPFTMETVLDEARRLFAADDGEPAAPERPWRVVT